MSVEYWPWWLGALGFASAVALYWSATGRLLGVSGLWERLLNWREEREADRAEAEIDAIGEDGLLQALRATTDAERQTRSPSEPLPAHGDSATHMDGRDTTRLPVTAGAVFLACTLAGSTIAALAADRFRVRLHLGPEFTALFGDGWGSAVVLLGGGFLVGLGTWLAAGCTSGHGLSGCARLDKGSLLCTASFFGSAVVASLVLAAVLL